MCRPVDPITHLMAGRMGERVVAIALRAQGFPLGASSLRSEFQPVTSFWGPPPTKMGDLEPKGVELMPKPHPSITHSPENDKFGLRVRGSGGFRRPALKETHPVF